MGKTNLLDAVYYLSMTKSFLQSSDQFVYTHGENSATLYGQYEKDGVEEKISIQLSDRQEKKVRRNQKNYDRISDHIGFIPVVVISPGDSSLINGSGEERRRFMNIVLSQTDPAYLRAVQSYNRALLQRNKLLKAENVSALLLEAMSMKMEKDAVYIHSRRKELADVISERCKQYYSLLSGNGEQVDIQYRSDLDNASYTELLAGSLERDMILGYTSKGLHRDDMELLIDGFPVRRCASQGQQKSFLIALKLAQFSIMKECYGYSPLLLLDDIFDKLDYERVRVLMKMVSDGDFGQIFISDTNRERVMAIVNNIGQNREQAFFTVENGIIVRENG